MEILCESCRIPKEELNDISRAIILGITLGIIIRSSVGRARLLPSPTVHSSFS